VAMRYAFSLLYRYPRTRTVKTRNMAE